MSVFTRWRRNDKLRRSNEAPHDQCADVWPQADANDDAMLRVGGLKLRSSLAVMACMESETDVRSVQTVHSPLFAVIRNHKPMWRETFFLSDEWELSFPTVSQSSLGGDVSVATNHHRVVSI